ncbi:MAG: hypothetical protein HYX75_24750 [Acidobacteria bacterium]|nr:hypothetical protein [Acidobacteriota bacterium]
MNVARLVMAAIAALVVLLVLNMFVFPFVFPTGVSSKFVNTRSEPLLFLHLAALVATAVLLTMLCVLTRPAGTSLGAAGIGAVAGLLSSLPSSLHTHAMAHIQTSAEAAAVIWTTVTWSVAGAAAHWVYRWRGVRRGA